MADYRVQLGVELNTKDIDSKIKNYKGKPIELSAKLNTSNIEKELASYKAKQPIEVGVKLNTTGIAKKIGEYKPKTPVTLRAELNTADIDSAISSYTAKNKKITIGAQLNTQDIQTAIQNYAAKTKPVIEVDAKLNDKAIDTAIQNYKPKQRIKVALALNAADIETKIGEYEARSPLRVKVKINKTDINKQLSEYNDADAHITVKAKLDNGAISEAIRNYKAKTPIKVDLELDHTDIEKKLNAYKAKAPVELPVNMKLNAKDVSAQLRKYRLTVPVEALVANLETADIDKKLATYKTNTPIRVGVKLDNKDINAQIAKLPKPTESINVGIKLDANSVNDDIALFKPIATLGVKPDLILEDVDEQIRAYVPKAKIKVDVKLDENSINQASGKQKKQNPIQVNVKLDTKNINEQLKGFTTKTAIKVGVKLDAQKINEQIRGFKTSAAVKLPVKLDISNVQNQISNLRRQIESLGNVRINLGGGTGGGSGSGSGNTGRNATRQAEEVTRAYKELLSVQSRMDSKQKTIAKLDTTKNQKEILELANQIRYLSQRWDELQNRFGTQFNATQIDNLNRKFQKLSEDINLVNRKVADAQANFAKSIKINISNGNLQNDIGAVEQKFNQLGIESQEVTNDIAELRRLLSSMNDSDDIESVTTDYQDFLQLLQTVNNAVAGLKMKMDEDNRPEILDAAKESAMQRLNGLFEDGSQAAKVYGARAAKLRDELNQVGNVKGVDIVNRKIKNLGTEIKNSHLQTKTWSTSIKEQLSRYSHYLSVASVFMYGMQAARSMFEQVKAIDSAMTELKKVTNETDAAYNQYLKNAASRAKELGTTIDGLVASTADFARLGYGFKDSQELAEVANIYAVVGDEIEGVEDATQSLVSTMAAFKDEMNGMSNSDFAMSIVDKMNEVSNNFAISSGGIGEALQRSASSMAAANNSIDETIAMITAANEVAQNPEKVGNAMKTKFLYNCLNVQKCA